MRKKNKIIKGIFVSVLLVSPIFLSIPFMVYGNVKTSNEQLPVTYSEEILLQSENTDNQNKYWYIGVIVAGVILVVIIFLIIWRIRRQIKDKNVREKKLKSVPLKQLYDHDYYCKNRISDQDVLIKEYE